MRDLFLKAAVPVCLGCYSSGNYSSHFSVLFSFRDHFEWNKVTSCIHNILSGQRWIEHYGEIVIKNLNDDSCHCKVNFIKVTPGGHGSSDLGRPWQSRGSGHRLSGSIFHLHFCASKHAVLGAPWSQPHLSHGGQGQGGPGLLPSTLTPLWSVLSAAARGTLLKHKASCYTVDEP